MYKLTEGALDQIMNGVEVKQPILQILGHRQLVSANMQECYRLLVSDGVRINFYVMLAKQLNSLITENKLTKFSVCQINRYGISVINNSGRQKKVMVIADLDVKIPGEEVGAKIGNPTQQDGTQPNGDAVSTAALAPQAFNFRNYDRNAQPQQSHPNETLSGGGDITISSIASLSPENYFWVIRAKVVEKTDIQSWNKRQSKGSYFSMDLFDKSGVIRCTVFTEQCNKYHTTIELGKTYYISKCQVKPTKKRYQNLNNKYEMTVNNGTLFIAYHEDSTEIPISKIDSNEQNEMMNLLDVSTSRRDKPISVEPGMMISRTMIENSISKNRNVDLVDKSNTMVTPTLSGNQAEFDGSSNPDVAVKGAHITERSGEKSSTSSVLLIDPDVPETQRHSTTPKHIQTTSSNDEPPRKKIATAKSGKAEIQRLEKKLEAMSANKSKKVEETKSDESKQSEEDSKDTNVSTLNKSSSTVDPENRENVLSKTEVQKIRSLLHFKDSTTAMDQRDKPDFQRDIEKQIAEMKSQIKTVIDQNKEILKGLPNMKSQSHSSERMEEEEETEESIKRKISQLQEMMPDSDADDSDEEF